MARPPSSHLIQIEGELRSRLLRMPHTPGARFYSNRALAAAYGISQQSAHRILDRLCAEGLLIRKPASGTYLPGPAEMPPQKVILVFNQRARRRDSFGRHLLALLTREIEKEGIAYSIQFSNTSTPYIPDPLHFPVFWEVDENRLRHWTPGNFGLILHREPPLGLAASWLDSLLVDDRSGGVMAGQIIREQFHIETDIVVLAGPFHDPRSRLRVAGFQTIFPDARILSAGGWFRQHGQEAAPEVFRLKPRALFCCNDRLAEGLILHAGKVGRELPPLIGFDNAPVSRELEFNTIAIPWDHMVETSLTLIRSRLGGDRKTSSQRILTPVPLLRNRR